MKTDSSIYAPHIKWNQDISTDLTSDFWTCRNTFTMTTNTNLQFIQYKVIHRTHITQYKKQNKMGLSDKVQSAPSKSQKITFMQFGHVHQFTIFGTQKHKNMPILWSAQSRQSD